MPDLHDYEYAVYTALCACFSLSPSSPEAAYRFRPAYPSDTTLPQPPRDKDVCYISLSPDTAPDPQYFTVLRADPDQDTWYHVTPLSLRLCFYGPHARDHALSVWVLLYTDPIRSLLRKSGIIPIPSPAPPTTFPELEGTLWRSRADLTLSLRVLQSTQTPATSITTPPELFIHPTP